MNNKIIYKKTSDYDTISSTDNSQMDLDDSIISLDIKKYNSNTDSDTDTSSDTSINSNSQQIHTNNINLMQNINRELFSDLNDNNDNNNKNIKNFNLTGESISNNNISNIKNYPSQNTLFDKLISNGINSWIFICIIIVIISFIIIILNKK